MKDKKSKKKIPIFLACITLIGERAGRGKSRSGVNIRTSALNMLIYKFQLDFQVQMSSRLARHSRSSAEKSELQMQIRETFCLDGI